VTYSDERRARVLEALSDADGTISLQPFSDWYENWRFDGDALANMWLHAGDDSGSSDEDAWCCDSCFETNTTDRTQCTYCETANPAVAAAAAATATTASSVSNTLQACVICSDSCTATSIFTVPACGHQVSTNLQCCCAHHRNLYLFRCSIRRLV
jgi:hypothetical protein